MSQVRKMPTINELYEEIAEYLNIEQSAILIGFIENVDSLNLLISEIRKYYEDKGFKIGLPIMHAGFRSYQNGYNSLIDEILQMNLKGLIKQLRILSSVETE